MDELKWEHADEWKCAGNDFMVMVRRHYDEPPAYITRLYSRGPHMWCVYAYIYPNHPHFERIQGDDWRQESLSELPLHCGVSYFKRHWDGENNTSIQVGCDYSHIYDDRYTRMETKEDAASVFCDAEELFRWLAYRRINGEEE